MASIIPARSDIPADDELDDILNGIVDGKDVFDTSDIQARAQPPAHQKSANDSNLGLEEIKIVKQRRPIPKLDDNRLLSDAGIPKLRKISKDRLKFKGKGHEYGDIARMLNMYQLWLDDLYPRAKFADGLAMIEKLGHTKRIQYMRKEWINEGKPKPVDESDTDEPTATVSATERPIDTMEGVETTEAVGHGEPLAQKRGSSQHPSDVTATRVDAVEPDEDELDALLAEEAEPASMSVHVPLPSRPAPEEDAFADEMEAMADMDW